MAQGCSSKRNTVNAQRALVEGSGNGILKKRKRRRGRVRDGSVSGVNDASGVADEMEDARPRKVTKVTEQGQKPGGINDNDAAHATSRGSESEPGFGQTKEKEASKAKQRDVSSASADGTPVDPALLGQCNSNANANAFISAIMAAAAASSGTSLTPTSAVHQSPSLQNTFGFPHYPGPYGLSGFSGVAPTQPNGIVPSYSPNALPQIIEGGEQPLNEDIVRLLQEIDVAKLANTLRALGDVSSAMFSLPGQLDASQGSLPSATQAGTSHDRDSLSLHTSHPIIGGQIPAPSALILGQPPRHQAKLMPSRKRSPTMLPPVMDQDPEHAQLLAGKWLSATKLNELSKTKGLVYKKGKFSTTEENTVKAAIENYRLKHNLSSTQLHDIIYTKSSKNKDNAFWFEITAQVPQRPVVAVYHYVRRSFHPMKQQGKWMPAEDEILKQAVAEFGQAWEKVSARVGRMAGDCRDRWRNHLHNREGRIMGAWTKEEEDRLTKIVMEMTTAQGRDPDLDVFWTQVAARMGNRGRHQCRIKWTDSLSKTIKNEGHKPRWSQQDAYILVHKIASLNVRDDSEIDWKALIDDDWNLWSAHTLQRRWLTLKRSVRGYEEMTHQEIMDILRVKKAHTPPNPPPLRSRITSAPIVPPEAQAADVDIGIPVSMDEPTEFEPVHHVGLDDSAPQFSSVAPADMQGNPGIVAGPVTESADASDDSSSSSPYSSSASDSDSDSDSDD